MSFEESADPTTDAESTAAPTVGIDATTMMWTRWRYAGTSGWCFKNPIRSRRASATTVAYGLEIQGYDGDTDARVEEQIPRRLDGFVDCG